MGAKPVAAFLSLALPRGLDPEWVEGFMDGFEALALRFRVQLAGGDTAEAPGEEILADVVCVGAVRKGREVRRSGAEVGDAIYVTGSLGGSALELAGFAAGEPCPTVDRPGWPNAFPQPRIKAGLKLADRWMATAGIDVSDGLSTDLWHLCEASGVGAEISAEAIPVAAGATLEQALHGGEDYELLFTTKPWVRVDRRMPGPTVKRIGTVTEKLGVRMDGAELKRGGWEHFSGDRD
jgi:thiamine-monophosphate kinase